jgi:hypothetical protein
VCELSQTATGQQRTDVMRGDFERAAAGEAPAARRRAAMARRLAVRVLTPSL